MIKIVVQFSAIGRIGRLLNPCYKMSKKIYPSDISRDQFENIREILESAMKKTCPRKYALFDIWNGINYTLKTGCQWAALPSDYPDYRSVHRYFMLWKKEDKNGNSILKRALKKNGFRRSKQPGTVLYDNLFDS